MDFCIVDNNELLTVNHFMENRRQKLLNYLQNEGRTSVNLLAETFNTSGATIRSDLRALEDEGLVLRRYGSAEACEPNKKIKPKAT